MARAHKVGSWDMIVQEVREVKKVNDSDGVDTSYAVVCKEEATTSKRLVIKFDDRATLDKSKLLPRMRFTLTAKIEQSTIQEWED